MIGTDIKVISGTAHPDLARDICEFLGVDLCPSSVVRFSNENMLVQIEENVREADVFVIQPSCPPVSDGIIELLIIIDALKHASAGRITAVLPYFPYARSDKKDRPRISITARLMADLLETAGANRVLTMNLHSPQVQGFFRIPADQLNATPILCDHLRATPRPRRTRAGGQRRRRVEGARRICEPFESADRHHRQASLRRRRRSRAPPA